MIRPSSGPGHEKRILSALAALGYAMPVLSAVEGPVLSAVEGPVLSAVEGLDWGALRE